MKKLKTMTEIFLSDIDFNDLKQAFELHICKRVDNDTFADCYHNLSYFIPEEVATDKWQTIKHICNLLKNDIEITS